MGVTSFEATMDISDYPFADFDVLIYPLPITWQFIQDRVIGFITRIDRIETNKIKIIGKMIDDFPIQKHSMSIEWGESHDSKVKIISLGLF